MAEFPGLWMARGAGAALAAAVTARRAGAVLAGFFAAAGFLAAFAPLGATVLATAGFFALVDLVAVFFAAILGSRQSYGLRRGRGIIHVKPALYRGMRPCPVSAHPHLWRGLPAALYLLGNHRRINA